MTARTALSAAVAATAALAGAAIAWRHPLAPAAATLAFAGWCLAAARWPTLWLAVVPAALPFANLLPWTGWLVFDEFDLLVLGALAGGYARRATAPAAVPVPRHGFPPAPAVALAVFAAASGVAFARGLLDAGGAGPADPFFHGYADALNAWRVFKPLPYALLLRTLPAGECGRAGRRFGLGVLAGLAVASLAVLWERAAHPGLLDWSGPYRATALFWEMHVGGAAIDGYLVLAAPFVVWALAGADTPARWAAAAALALLAAHAALATLSRGVYGAVAFSLLLLPLPAWRRRVRRGAAPRWRRRANAALAFALALECCAVLYASTFARERAADIAIDLGSRVEHWRRGVGLLRGADEWLLGAGTGRLPARFLGSADGHERPGALHLTDRARAGHALWLSGPVRTTALGSRHALAQRVDLDAQPREAVLTLRLLRDADLLLRVCERHLLYARRCAGAKLHVGAGGGAWQTVTAPLATPGDAPPPSRGERYAPRLGLFALSVLTPGASVELAQASLRGAAGDELLANGTFAAGLARWFPAAQTYFLPWHIDNLYLEVLIERGAFALLAFVALLAFGVRGALHMEEGAGCGGIAPFVAASLAGAALLGGVSSVLDTPRTAFLFLLMLVVAALAHRRAGDDGAPCRPTTPNSTAAAISAS